MSTHASHGKPERNDRLFRDWRSGMTQKEIAKKYGISQTRVSELVRTGVRRMDRKLQHAARCISEAVGTEHIPIVLPEVSSESMRHRVSSWEQSSFYRKEGYVEFCEKNGHSWHACSEEGVCICMRCLEEGGTYEEYATHGVWIDDRGHLRIGPREEG